MKKHYTAAKGYTFATATPHPHYNVQRQSNTTYGPHGSYLMNNLPAPVNAILDMHQRLEKVDIYAPPNPGPTNASRTPGTLGQTKARKARNSTQTNDSDTEEDDADDTAQTVGHRKNKTRHLHNDNIFYGVAHGQRIPNNNVEDDEEEVNACLLYTSPSPRDS